MFEYVELGRNNSEEEINMKRNFSQMDNNNDSDTCENNSKKKIISPRKLVKLNIERESKSRQLRSYYINEVPTSFSEKDLSDFFSMFGKPIKVQLSINKFGKTIAYVHLDYSNSEIPSTSSFGSFSYKNEIFNVQQNFNVSQLEERRTLYIKYDMLSIPTFKILKKFFDHHGINDLRYLKTKSHAFCVFEDIR
jgi:hypothetical protein